MRTQECLEIQTAIRELMQEDPAFERAVGRLCRLVGWRYPADDLTRGLKPAPLHELASGPDHPFSAGNES